MAYQPPTCVPPGAGVWEARGPARQVPCSGRTCRFRGAFSWVPGVGAGLSGSISGGRAGREGKKTHLAELKDGRDLLSQSQAGKVTPESAPSAGCNWICCGTETKKGGAERTGGHGRGPSPAGPGIARRVGILVGPLAGTFCGTNWTKDVYTTPCTRCRSARWVPTGVTPTGSQRPVGRESFQQPARDPVPS